MDSVATILDQFATTDHRDPSRTSHDVLEMTQAFVAVLLSGQAGPLTAMQTDLLETIRIQVANVIDMNQMT